MNENSGHVAVHADQDVTFWEFVLPSNVTSCEEQVEEMVGRCETLFETFEDFVVPTEINYHVHLFPSGQQLPVAMSDDEHVNTIGRELRNASGITAIDFRESARVEVSESRWIPRIGFDGTEVAVQLSDSTVAVSRRNRTVEYRSGEPTGNEPTRDPWS
ncbi:hypothetical protein CV102_04090 [Natronococcus pandeyae]|uniref:Uncharacterized protein n=1 Tax=Natronococcus pandeyae TaxID=2055836 RepID=A0A8J8Q5R6_9EURY|nr:hypothetical protein [Natronococcus pandeyae]TYL39484.1 hypothetical protein CV102_04090 [Natronococcus pandeyae]